MIRFFDLNLIRLDIPNELHESLDIFDHEHLPQPHWLPQKTGNHSEVRWYE